MTAPCYAHSYFIFFTSPLTSYNLIQPPRSQATKILRTRSPNFKSKAINPSYPLHKPHLFTKIKSNKQSTPKFSTLGFKQQNRKGDIGINNCDYDCENHDHQTSIAFLGPTVPNSHYRESTIDTEGGTVGGRQIPFV